MHISFFIDANDDGVIYHRSDWLSLIIIIHIYTYLESISFQFHYSIKCCGMYSMVMGNYTSKLNKGASLISMFTFESITFLCILSSYLYPTKNQRKTISMVVPLVWWTILLILWISAAIYFYIRSLFDEHSDIYEKWTPIIAGKKIFRFHLHVNSKMSIQSKIWTLSLL